MDATWKEWNTFTDEWEQYGYELYSTYTRDGKKASEEEGIWSENDSHFSLSSAVSDDTVFAFDLYIEGERLFIYVDENWHQGSTEDRFIHEFTPLDHPFEWMRELLLEADTVEKNDNPITNEVTYVATFYEFDELDFRGYSFKDQENTTLTVVVVNDEPKKMSFHAIPIRPDYVGRFDGYPEEVMYEMTFTKTDERPNALPKKAYESEQLE